MKMRPLILNEQSLAKIQALIQYAEANRFPFRKIVRIVEGVDPPPGDDPQFVCVVPWGFRCAFTIEEHRNEKWFRHLSVSIDTPGKYPNDAAVESLMGEFGMKPSLRDSRVYVEEHVQAISILQPL